jgi:hypothetical protein
LSKSFTDGFSAATLSHETEVEWFRSGAGVEVGRFNGALKPVSKSDLEPSKHPEMSPRSQDREHDSEIFLSSRLYAGVSSKEAEP